MFTGSVLLSNIVILHSGNTLKDIYRFLYQLIGIMYVGLQGGRDIHMAKSHLHILDICATLDEQGSVSVTQAVIIEDLILKSSISKCSKFFNKNITLQEE